PEPGQVRVLEGLRTDEERVDEVLELEARLAHEGAQPVAAAQPPKPGCREAHANNLRAPRRASVPKTSPSASSQSAWRSSSPQGLRSHRAALKKSTACVNGSNVLTHPAGGTICGGIR